MVAMHALRIVGVAMLLAGCDLVDQTTFAPSPEASTAVVEPPRADPRTPLLTIVDATPPDDYQDLLRYAVREAETRAPGVQYDVIAMVPTTANAAVVKVRAVEVMRGVMAQGVPAARVHLGLRLAQAGGVQEVRVYVR